MLFSYGGSFFFSEVICTSALPQLNKWSLLKAVLTIPFNLIRGKKAMNPRSLKFKFKVGQYPEIVDYEGQKAQIDMAKTLGVEQVVIIRYASLGSQLDFASSIYLHGQVVVFNTFSSYLRSFL